MNQGNDHIVASDLEKQTAALFAQSVAATDGATQSRLSQARHRAIAQLAKPPRQKGWLPAAVAATALFVTVVLIRLPDPDPGFAAAAATDLELLLGVEELELIEDLDFYAWLDEQPDLEEAQIQSNGVG